MSSSPQPADQLSLLRQQLLLAQVRLMELEDTRDELAPRLAEAEQLLAAAQALAEAKAGDAAHLEKVRADLQAEFDHLRHVQHTTNEALNAARAETAAGTAREQSLLAEVELLQVLTRQQAEAARQQAEQLAATESRARAAEATSASRATRIQELDRERHTLKASRSWRWTAWLRALERLFRK